MDEYTLVVGLVQRTDQAGFHNVASQLERLGYTLIPVPCPADNLHLDMCFNVAAEKVAVVCPEALPEAFLQNLKKRKFILIEVSVEKGILKDTGLSFDATHTNANTIKKVPERIMKHLARRIIRAIEEENGEIPILDTLQTDSVEAIIPVNF